MGSTATSATLKRFFITETSPSDKIIELLCRWTEDVIRISQETNIENLPELLPFVKRLVIASKISVPVLILPLVLLQRLRLKFEETVIKGMKCTPHRIILGSLCLSMKYLHDVPLSNLSWAEHSQIFSVNEVNLMERQLLKLFVSITSIASNNQDYNIEINPADLETIIKQQFDKRKINSRETKRKYVAFLEYPQKKIIISDKQRQLCQFMHQINTYAKNSRNVRFTPISNILEKHI